MRTLDHRTGKLRPGVIDDIRRTAAVCEALPNIAMVASLGYPTDVPPEDEALETVIAMTENASKPLAFLAHDDAVDLVAHNLPVRQEDRTLGEFDILYFCRRRNCHVHLELAVKFYLGRAPGDCTGDASAWRYWLGPDARDRLDIKMERMLGHQIRLGAAPAALPLLASLGVERLAREIEIKGYLFRPLFSDLAPPTALNRHQRLHPWLPLTALAEAPREIIADGYQVLPRAHWLSAAHLNPAQASLSLSELEQVLKEEMNQRPGPRLVAALDCNGEEIERFFVTSDDWPAPSIPAANP